LCRRAWNLVWCIRAPKQLMTGGHWVPAASGKTFESINPSTDEVIAPLAEGDKAGIDKAVAAARRAFEGPLEQVQVHAGSASKRLAPAP